MFAHNKRLQYTVRVSSCNPGLANLLLEQFGGPHGELAAAMRYFTQAVGEDWNSDENFEVVSDREEQQAVDGGDGLATVGLDADELATVQAMAQRTQSDPDVNPTTGAELGMDPALAAAEEAGADDDAETVTKAAAKKSARSKK